MGTKRGIPRAQRFVLMELSLKARRLGGRVELPSGMSYIDAVHDLLGGNRKEIADALATFGAEVEPVITFATEGTRRYLVLTSWQKWNPGGEAPGASTERSRRSREAMRAAATVEQRSSDGRATVDASPPPPALPSRCDEPATVSRRRERGRAEGDPDGEALKTSTVDPPVARVDRHKSRARDIKDSSAPSPTSEQPVAAAEDHPVVAAHPSQPGAPPVAERLAPPPAAPAAPPEPCPGLPAIADAEFLAGLFRSVPALSRLAGRERELDGIAGRCATGAVTCELVRGAFDEFCDAHAHELASMDESAVFSKFNRFVMQARKNARRGDGRLPAQEGGKAAVSLPGVGRVPGPDGAAVCAYAEGQERASGKPYPRVQGDRREREALAVAIDTFGPGPDVSDEAKCEWIRETSAAYRAAQPDPTYEKGYNPSAFLRWLQGGQPSALAALRRRQGLPMTLDDERLARGERLHWMPAEGSA